MMGGVGRAGRRRRERRVSQRESQAETEALRAHNERLERELEQERASSDTYPDEPVNDTTTRGRTVTGGRHRG
jgi:hypothetical protein